MNLFTYKQKDEFFSPLLANGGNLIGEALVKDNDKIKLPLCNTCYTSLTKGVEPKFSQAAGFSLCDIPDELAKLNDIEARMIGLGVCFTTCYRLRGGGQHATRGNSISYWNQTYETVTRLPRPITKCGVIYLRTEEERNGTYEIRPHYLRAALHWLIQNNPLYKSIEIDEQLLNELEQSNNLPELVLNESDEESDTTLREDEQYNMDKSITASPIEIHTNNVHEVEDNLVDTFEMPTGDFDCLTESERIIAMLNGQNTMDVETITIPSLNETMNEYTIQDLMQQCFPTLFPNGCGGFNAISSETRVGTYNLSEYFAHLMMWHDRRFVMHPTFKFFCLNFLQRRQIDGLTKRASSRSNNENIMYSHNDNDDDVIKKLLRQLKPYFKSVRGSGLYWADVRSELMAMLGSDSLSVPWPTFFFTLSAADTVWPDFFRACNPMLTLEQASTLSQEQRYKYLNEHPDIAARHFHRRFKAFMLNIIQGEDEPLGHVVDFFWRVEFQKRGSPHIHGLLWVEDAPDINKLCKTNEGCQQIRDYVDQYIYAQTLSVEELQNCSCKTCLDISNGIDRDILTRRPPTLPEHWQCDLRRVVERVQQHICFRTSICHIKDGTCRFKYPKMLRECTEIELQELSNNVVKVNVHCRRNNPFINYFNPQMILSWRANMDIKLIGNAFGAAEYTAAYISKSEPDTSRFRNAIRKALNRVSQSTGSYSVLRRVANATISVREVSAQEAMWILLPGLPMTEKSRSIVRVKTLRHSKRSHWISPDECIREVNEKTCDVIVSDPQPDALERLYMARPHIELFENMTYKYFCQHYEAFKQPPSKNQRLERYTRTDHLGYIKEKRQAQVILKSPTIKPDITNPDYCFQELLLRTCWRNVNDLPDDDDECIMRFNTLCNESTNDAADILDNMQRQNASNVMSLHDIEQSENQPEYDWEQYQQSNQPIIPSNDPISYHSLPAVCQCTLHEYEHAEKFITTDVINGINSRREQQHIVDYIPYMYPIGLDGYNMNDEQWLPFAMCMKQSRNRLATNHKCHALRLILNGEGGSGKSWLLNHIVKDVYEVFDGNQRQNKLRVLLMAHQGTAAFNIHGTTICSSLAIPRHFSNKYISLTENKTSLATLKRLQEKYTDVHLVIIDEFSVISCTLLYWIERRLREIFPSRCHDDNLFGNRDIILCGDTGQLNPVNAHSLSTQEEHLQNETEITGRKIWTNIKNVCYLRSQNRGSRDPEWYDALRRLRVMEETNEDLTLFNSRFLSHQSRPHWMYNATHIAYTNEVVDETNNLCITHQPNPVFLFTAMHQLYEKDPNVPLDITDTTLREIYNEVTTRKQQRDSVVPLKITLALGAPVVLTYNAAQAAGLCNGTKAVIHGFLCCSQKKLPIVLIRITDRYTGPSFRDVPNVVPIPPKSITCAVKHANIRVCRVGIPLRLAYGTTIHKVQGLTCTKVVFNPTSIPSSSFAYVALSRVKERDDIILTEQLIINKTPSQLHEREKLQNECIRLDTLAITTRQKWQIFVNTMKHIAMRHNERV